MNRPSNRNKVKEEMPLDIMAEKALKEAVAEAIAEHKLRGHPIVIWRNGGVVSIPPEEIVVPDVKGNRKRNDNLFYVKERNQPYSKTKKQGKK